MRILGLQREVPHRIFHLTYLLLDASEPCSSCAKYLARSKSCYTIGFVRLYACLRTSGFGVRLRVRFGDLLGRADRSHLVSSQGAFVSCFVFTDLCSYQTMYQDGLRDVAR
jgi:hypothetical protein